MRETLTAADLRAEAEECLKSSQGNGEYNTPFYVAHIVLSALARRLEADADEGQPS